MKRSWIETFSESLGLIPKISDRPDYSADIEGPRELYRYPHPSEWDDFTELDPKAWPNKKERHYSIVPTTCFNCESACGLLAYIDKDSNEVRKFEGNPHHPGSRGRNCAKGPATINQINDTERILYPLKRQGKRGEGKWKQITWDQALKEISEKINVENRLILSVAAGVKLKSIENWLGQSSSVVRVMPNMPALIQAGASALYANTQVQEKQKNILLHITRREQ